MKVAVIGAGVSGLPSIKSCLDEGLEVICFEKSHDIGGLWRFEEGEKHGATVYKTTVINSSKETLAYSDFPIPKNFPNFMHHTKCMEYYRSYADRFGLLKHIRFNSAVMSCRPHESFDETGKWTLVVQNTKTNETETLCFDGVMVCIGHHAQPYLPLKDFPGLEKFKGFYLHSNSYRDTVKYTDKNVVVIGSGNSGCDIAVELSRCTKQTYLSTRRGAWVFNRILDNGAPFDLLLITRYKTWLMNNIPSLMNPFFESVLNSKFDHAKYGLKPQHRVLSQHPTVNDELPNRIVNGTVIIKGNVTGFTEDEAIFSDGSREKTDAVIFATGFSFSFPFLDGDIIKVNNNESRLYHLMWPINLRQNTLAVIGLTQPFGVIGPVSELQARWAARVIKREQKLLPANTMQKEFEELMNKMKKKYIHSPRHTIEVDGVRYMDTIAKQLSCKPNVWKLAITDPVLAWKIVFGPFTCTQYRLTGPGKWVDARKTIMTHWDRVWYPMKREEVKDSAGISWLLVLVVLLLACAVYAFTNLI